MATVASPQYGRAIGRFWVSASLGYASLTLLGGFLYQYFQVNYLFILGALYAFSGCLVILFAPSDALTLTKSLERPRGYWGLLRQRKIALLCLLSVAVLVSASAFNSFFTVYLVNILHGSKLVAGLAATATTIFGALAYRNVGPLAGGLIADAAQLQAVIVFSLAIALATVVSSQLLLKESPRTTIATSIRTNP